MSTICPLCIQKGNSYYKDARHLFYLCPNCGGIFRDRNQLLEPQLEKERYLLHQYKPEDAGYYNFIHPIIAEVHKNFHRGDTGIDYGCGHIPVLSEYLSKEGFQMSIYDPFFFDQPLALKKKYNFIVSCEVIEHFYDPSTEFSRLFSMLNPGGKLICKTHLFDTDIDFASWYYKNDPSHVFIYTKESLEWIAKNFNFKHVKINQRLITFSK